VSSSAAGWSVTGQPLLFLMNRSYWNQYLIMLRSWRAAHVFSLGLVFLAFVAPAFAQDFTMTASQPSPSSVDPGVSSVATITLGSVNGFNNAVDLSCTVAPQQANGATCLIEASATPPATAALTVNTTSTTPPAIYQVTVTGTDPTTGLTHAVPVNLTVLALTPAYTIAVTTAVSPTSVHAGSTATAVITVTPTNGYTGTVTLSCSAITPTVTPAPTCAFNPSPVAITDNNAQTSTLTISTTGPSAALAHPRIFYALLLPLPGLALVGLGGVGTRSVKRIVALGVVVLATAGGLLFAPACGGGYGSSTSNSSVTPKNTYTLTVTGTDGNALAPSNGTQSITLTVN
jgi:hypothetical protein